MSGGELLIIAICGFSAGGLAGLFGVGGGFLIVPLLSAVLDVPTAVIVGSTVCSVLGPATTSLLARKTRFEDWRFPLTIFIGLAVGVLGGANLLAGLTEANPDRVENWILAVYAVLLTFLGGWTAVDVILAEWGGRRIPRGWLQFPWLRPLVKVEDRGGKVIQISIISAVVTSIAVGLLCGLLGISGGLVTVPLFAYGFGMRIRLAVRLSLITVWLASVQSTMVHAWLNHVDLPTVMCLLLGGTIGARLATTFSRKLSPLTLRAGFAGLLIACAIFVLARLML